MEFLDVAIHAEDTFVERLAEIDQQQIRPLPCRSENLTSHCTFNLYGRLVTLSIVQSAERDGFMFP